MAPFLFKEKSCRPFRQKSTFVFPKNFTSYWAPKDVTSFAIKEEFFARVKQVLPTCRRLLFPLLYAEKGRLRNPITNRVPAPRWVPKILGTCCDRLTHSAHCLTWLIGCYRIWSDNVCGDLCNRAFPAKTNQNMCHCEQTVRNLLRGRGKFNGCEKIISLLCIQYNTIVY